MIERFHLPAGLAASDRRNSFIDRSIGVCHPLERWPVDHQIGSEQVEKREQIPCAELDRGRCKEDDRLGVIGEQPQSLIQIRISVPSVMSFVDDKQVESRRWVEGRKPLGTAATARRIAVEQVLVDQREGKDRPCVSLWPLPIQVRLVETVTQLHPGQGYKLLVEAAHLAMPFLLNNQRLRAYDQNRA